MLPNIVFELARLAVRDYPDSDSHGIIIWPDGTLSYYEHASSCDAAWNEIDELNKQG